jgi:hypothetical protein
VRAQKISIEPFPFGRQMELPAENDMRPAVSRITFIGCIRGVD